MRTRQIFCCIIVVIILPLNAQNITNKLGGNTANEIYDVTDSADKVLFRVQGDGNVGVGTNSPLSKLSVGGNGVANAAIFGDGTIDGATTHYGGYFAADEMEGIGLYVSGHYRSGIFNGGPLVVQYTLGVGTPDPQANLDVHGTVKVFGAWDNLTYTRDVAYQATTDGTVHASFRTNGSGVAIIGKTDSATSPTTTRVVESVPNLGDIAWVSITMSVKKGDYWIVTDEGTNVGEEIINWIPLGQ